MWMIESRRDGNLLGTPIENMRYVIIPRLPLARHVAGTGQILVTVGLRFGNRSYNENSLLDSRGVSIELKLIGKPNQTRSKHMTNRQFELFDAFSADNLHPIRRTPGKWRDCRRR